MLLGGVDGGGKSGYYASYTTIEQYKYTCAPLRGATLSAWGAQGLCCNHKVGKRGIFGDKKIGQKQQGVKMGAENG